MGEGSFQGVEGLAFDEGGVGAVHIVAEDWEIDGGKVQSDLMRASCFEVEFEEGVVIVAVQEAVVCDSGVTVCANGAAVGLCRVFTDGEVDGAVGVRRDALDEGDIGASEGMAISLFGQGAFCFGIFGEDHTA